jgi:hypothetical protein
LRVQKMNKAAIVSTVRSRLSLEPMLCSVRRISVEFKKSRASCAVGIRNGAGHGHVDTDDTCFKKSIEYL